MVEKTNHSLIIGDWQVCPETGQLTRDDDIRHIRPRQMKLLLYLARHQGKVVTIDDIFRNVWEGVAVSDVALYYSVSRLRKALRDNSREPEFIETIPKCGYRLVAPVQFMGGLEDGLESVGVHSETENNRPSLFSLHKGLWAALAALTILAILQLMPGPPPQGTNVPMASIAVLPFADLSPNSDKEYFADGVAENLLNALAKVPQLKVTGRTSSFTFKGRNEDLREIGETLGVAHILEGSVHHTGNRVRVTAQLIDADTGFHIWSNSYDRDLIDIFDVQDEISAAIVSALTRELGLEFEPASSVARTTSSEAYNKYLLGILEINRRTASSLEAARDHLKEAVRLDPNFAPAHAQLAMTLSLLYQYNRNYSLEGTREVRTLHAARAMALAPESYESVSAMAFSAWQDDAMPLTDIRDALERVIALNPSFTDAMNWLAVIYQQMGDYQAQSEMHARALRVDPLSFLTLRNSIGELLSRNRIDEAKVLIDRLQAISPFGYSAHMADWFLFQGDVVEAALPQLEAMGLNPEALRIRYGLASHLAWRFDLPDEALRADSGLALPRIMAGKTESVLEEARRRSDRSPRFADYYGWALMQAHRFDEAVHTYARWRKHQSEFRPEYARSPPALVNNARALQLSGDEEGGRKILEVALEAIARRRAAGQDNVELDSVEGMARYFLGEKEEGLALIRESQTAIPARHMPEVQLEALLDDPAYVALMDEILVRVHTNRDKFLSVICNGGNPAPDVWTPMPETCEVYIEN